MNEFNHNLYRFFRSEEQGYWYTTSGFNLSDMYREQVKLVDDGIPESAIKMVSWDGDCIRGRRYYRLTIAFSADEQIAALAERQRQARIARDAEHYENLAVAQRNRAQYGEGKEFA